MKCIKLFTLISITFWVAIGACNKKEQTDPSNASFAINGKEWKSDMMDGKLSSGKKIGFTFAKGVHDGSASDHDATLAFDETISLEFLDKKLGKQNLQSLRIEDLGNLTEDSQGYALLNTFSDQGCVACELFIVDGTKLEHNWVEITKEEGNYQKVWGKFNLVLIKHQSAAYCGNYPDTIRIENGEFYVEL